MRKPIAAGRYIRRSGNGLPYSWHRDDDGGARVLQAYGAAMRLDEYAGFTFLLPARDAAAQLDVTRCESACRAARS